MDDFALARYQPVPNNRDTTVHLEVLTPAGPRRRCHPHFAFAGDFETGVSDFLLKLTDPQLRGPAAHWDGVCIECRRSLGIDDLVRARAAWARADCCRHGTSIAEPCTACEMGLRSHCELAAEDAPLEGWEVLPFGRPVEVPPGGTVDLCASAQKIMRGPYRLRVHVNGGDERPELYIQCAKIGQNMLANAWGEIWGWSFEDIDPQKSVADRLLPIAGPVINLGVMATLSLHNAGVKTLRVSAVLYGHGMREERDFGSWDPGVPRARAVARRMLRGADPGRPPQLPGNLSVPLPAWSKHALGISGDLDAQFALECDGDFEFPRAAEENPSRVNLPRLLEAARRKNIESMPIAPTRRANPVEVLLDLGSELMILRHQANSAITYEPIGDQGRLVLRAVMLLRELQRFWEPSEGEPPPKPELFVPPRFELAGVLFEVRRYEPPPPPEPTEAQKRRGDDQAATLAYLESRRAAEAAETDDDGAWQSASDES